MKTQGIEIVCGYLVLPHPKSVPPAFWSRLKHEIAKACLTDEFRADYALEAKTDGAPWEREERLFRRWVLRLELASEPWPWQRGWTPDAVDSYLTREAP